MAVTVRDHWRWRSRIPVPRPNGLRRSVGAHAGRTRCDRSGHRRSAPGLPASPATTRAGVLCGFPHPAQRLVRRQGSVLPGGAPHGCPQPRRRGLTRPCTRCGGDGHRGLMRACALRGGNGHRGYTRACALCGGNGHPGLTCTCALRCHGVGLGDWRIEDGSCLGFHRLRLHRHGQSSRRCWCVLLTGTDRLRGDSHRIGRRRINAVRGIGPRDQDRREGSQAPARSQRRGGQLRLLHGCRDADVAWCWPRRCRVSGWQHWRRIRRGE